MTEETKDVVDFEAANEQDQWQIINDGVMGGLSRSSIELTAEGVAVFEGTLSLENNGGFASVRRESGDYELAGFDGILLRVKSDGRAYQLRVRTNDRFDGVSYAADVVPEAGQWVTVSVPFSSMKATFRGRPVPSAPELDPKDIRQIGFLIGDKREGAFRLEIVGIQAYRPQLQE